MTFFTSKKKVLSSLISASLTLLVSHSAQAYYKGIHDSPHMIKKFPDVIAKHKDNKEFSLTNRVCYLQLTHTQVNTHITTLDSSPTEQDDTDETNDEDDYACDSSDDSAYDDSADASNDEDDASVSPEQVAINQMTNFFNLHAPVLAEKIKTEEENISGLIVGPPSFYPDIVETRRSKKPFSSSFEQDPGELVIKQGIFTSTMEVECSGLVSYNNIH